MMKLLF